MGFAAGWLARVTLSAVKGGNEVVNTLHYNTDGSVLGNNTPLQELADRIRDDVLDEYRAFFNSSWSIQPVLVTEEVDPLNPGDPREQVTAGPGGGGTSVHANEGLGLQMCAMATERSGVIGRSFVGRIWLPPAFSTTYVDDGGFIGNYVARCNAFLSAIPIEPDLVTGNAGDRTRLCVYSRTRRARNQNPYAVDVETITLDTRRRWLRSRSD